MPRTMSRSRYRWIVAIAIGAITGVVGCTTAHKADNTGKPVPTKAALETDYQLGSIGERAEQLFASISPAITCEEKHGPTDMLQSPVEVGLIYCNDLNAILALFTYDDTAGMHYQIDSTTVGDGTSRGFLIGPDWLIYAAPATLADIRGMIGGTLYNDKDKDKALADHPGYSENGKFADCYTSLTSAVIQFVTTGTSHLDEIDQIIPGISSAYDAEMYGVVPQLSSYKAGDSEAASADLIPYAGRLRAICHQLRPGPPS